MSQNDCMEHWPYFDHKLTATIQKLLHFSTKYTSSGRRHHDSCNVITWGQIHVASLPVQTQPKLVGRHYKKLEFMNLDKARP